MVRMLASGLVLSMVAGHSGSVAANAQETLKITSKDSKIEFIGYKSRGKHEGGFKKFSGEVVVNLDDPSRSRLKIEIDTTSLYSDHPQLTAHLKSPDFFDIRKHPKATFESTEVKPEEPGKGKITGKFTLLGVTKEITIPVDVLVTEQKLVLKTTFQIDRTDFGMDYGVGEVKKEVKIRAELSMVR